VDATAHADCTNDRTVDDDEHGTFTNDELSGPRLTTLDANRGRSRQHSSNSAVLVRPVPLNAPPRPCLVAGIALPVRGSDAVPYVALSLQEFAGIC
jgi:hypothetical protein